MKIFDANLKIILDSRGNETLSADLRGLNADQRGQASVPSGKSRGTHEAFVLEPKLALEKFEEIKPGQIVRVYWKIKEDLRAGKAGQKERIQIFEGLVIARKHGSEPGATITVRRDKGGFGVERIFSIHSPLIDKIEIIKQTKARRAKLYYVRKKKK